MRYLLALLTACPLAAFAADTLPAHLVGTWGTDPSMDLRTPGHQIMLLRRDGYGMILASRPSVNGKPGEIDLLAFPARVTLEGEVLTLKPVQSGKSPESLEKQNVSCRHNAAAATLDCSSLNGAGGLFRRDTETVAEKWSQQLDKLRQAQEARP
jgi:hypothetical protein